MKNFIQMYKFVCLCICGRTFCSSRQESHVNFRVFQRLTLFPSFGTVLGTKFYTGNFMTTLSPTKKVPTPYVIRIYLTSGHHSLSQSLPPWWFPRSLLLWREKDCSQLWPDNPIWSPVTEFLILMVCHYICGVWVFWTTSTWIRQCRVVLDV